MLLFIVKLTHRFNIFATENLQGNYKAKL